jgi:pyruvate,orthophosphate dikinase
MILTEDLHYWQQTTDINRWLNALKNKPDDMDFSHLPNDQFYAHWQEHLSRALEPNDFKIVPAFTEIATLHRDYIREFSSLSHRVQYIFFLLGQATMLDMMDHLLWDLNRQLADMYQELSVDEVHDMIDTVFETLKNFINTHMSIVLDCVLTIGKAVLKGNNGYLHKHIIEHIIDLGFTPPGEVRISGDWQIEVDKNHVKHLRILLELISINPLQNKDLLAFTIISLSKHGVFISDTDLFQKDVSAFLGANLKPIFVQSKHLLRMFPVFFNEIGAEGEIRDASTNLDEMSQRKDRLIHFLRKQVHTESNNTHITLIERILRYWITQDPAPLEHIIPADVWENIQEIDERIMEEAGRTAVEAVFLPSVQKRKLAEEYERKVNLFKKLEQSV